MNKIQRQKGFTLIELMIVIAIIGILVAIAYPSYLESVQKSRRGDAQAAMLEIANFMERKFTENNKYNSLSANATITASGVISDYYTLSLSTLTASAFTLSAAPQGSQSSDSCGTLTLTHTSVKGASITGCW